MQNNIIIEGANENNLKNISLEIPHNTFIVVTGVSGSGKSSLVYDILFREGQRRFLQSFSGSSKQYFGKLKKPDIQFISGIKPAISIDQKTAVSNVRSTVGTLSGLYDYLRLLFARLAVCDDIEPNIKPERRLFSFNSAYGACPVCKGLGFEERIDPEKLISDPNLSLSQGALVITAPNGYIIYSQVTMDVLNSVLNAHDFNVDIPWNRLNDEQKKIVLYGSEIIKIPFGKHTLESRMKWTGITAKPREEGYYRGIIPIMEDILKRDRNGNILRFVSAMKCSVCEGKRLRKEAMAFLFRGKNITDIASMTLDDSIAYFKELEFAEKEFVVGDAVRQVFLNRAEILQKLGIGYLSLDRESTTLSGGEAQRIRLATQIGCGLRNIMYILDEPSVGLHPRDNKKLMEVLKNLQNIGNTLIVVEHDEDTIAGADYIIDIGPGAGKNGGELLFSGYTNEKSKESTFGLKSETFDYLFGRKNIDIPESRRKGIGSIIMENVSRNNLKNIKVVFKTSAFNVITGVSGAGKSSLTEELKVRFNEKKLSENIIIDKIIDVDQSPIGRSPKSNPATYTGLFDYIRDLFASLPESKNRKYEKGRFSFNNKGGRCEICEGAGVIRIGMHFLGDVDALCEKCYGKRFNVETLEIYYKGKNIFDVLEMPVEEAVVFFSEQPKIMRFLNVLNDIGLGYISLGQPSTTISGGEAQRIKLATELAKPSGKHTLYILDEPSTGLHTSDIKILLDTINSLVEKCHTVVMIEHNLHFIKSADHIIDLGPESGISGGNVVFSGTPENLILCEESHTGYELKKLLNNSNFLFENIVDNLNHKNQSITFKGVVTNNLKNINVEIPVGKITVFTGLSGSGKSSLLMDTIYSECRQRFSENFPAWVRSHISKSEKPDFDLCSGLMPAIAVCQENNSKNPRSTVGTATEIYDYYRLLYARIGKNINKTKIDEDVLSSLFSFNHEAGACPFCKGLGFVVVCDENKLISNPEKSILNGAMDGTKTGKFYGDIYGQHVWTLRKVGEIHNVDFSLSWNDLDNDSRSIIMSGTGEEEYDVIWKYKRKNREGEYAFKTKWQGLFFYINEEYIRKHADDRGTGMLEVMKHDKCHFCNGSRLKEDALQYQFARLNIAELSEKSIDQAKIFFKKIENNPTEFNCSENDLIISKDLRKEVLRRLQFLTDAGLGYISLNRTFSSLSGGESRRAAIAGKLSSGLTGVLYILDEPTIGLHARDTAKLIKVITQLKNEGNTVALIEHDEDIILQADHIIDMGPGAGIHGGEIIFSGKLSDIVKCNNSITGKYLDKIVNGNNIFTKIKRKSSEVVSIKGAYANNLKNIDVDLPVGIFTIVTGVSGSGKTSLVFDVLNESAFLHKPVFCNSISGIEKFESVIAVTQNAIALSQAGNIATVCAFFDELRNMLSGTDEARKRGFDKSFFSFNNSGGRCETCKGHGRTKVSMDFLFDVWNDCEDCHGARFKPEVLLCYFHSKNIADILNLTVNEALLFFKENKKIIPTLKILYECGLDYLKLGQPSDTLSGGEAQRLKLARELITAKGKHNLYLLDEPTTGLHFHDVENLLVLIEKLINSGHTVIAVEHNKQMIANADNIIEIGPGAGCDGGEIIV